MKLPIFLSRNGLIMIFDNIRLHFVPRSTEIFKNTLLQMYNKYKLKPYRYKCAQWDYEELV